MKNNRKNRKLEFIREKNNLRLGKTKFYYYEKCSNNFFDTKEYLEPLIKRAQNDLFKRYKLKSKTNLIIKGLIEDDFIKDLKTMCIVLSN